MCRLVASFALAATLLGPAASVAPPNTSDEPAPCRAEQIAINPSSTQRAMTHHALTLIFTLASGAVPCTLAGYPEIESDAGEPPSTPGPTLRGYLGGLSTTETAPPVVILSLSQQAQAVVESTALDRAGCTVARLGSHE